MIDHAAPDTDLACFHMGKTTVAEVRALLAALDRYRYAVAWAAADSWDQSEESQTRFEWARSRDPVRVIDVSLDDTARIARGFYEEVT